MTALAAITIKNAASEIFNRLDFFISVVVEPTTASYGRHEILIEICRGMCADYFLQDPVFSFDLIWFAVLATFAIKTT